MFSLLWCSPIGKGWGKPIFCSFFLSLFLYCSRDAQLHTIFFTTSITLPPPLSSLHLRFAIFCAAWGSILHLSLWWCCLMNQPWIHRKRRRDLQWINFVVTCVPTNPLPWFYTINLSAIILTTLYLTDNHNLICNVANATRHLKHILYYKYISLCIVFWT